MADWFAAVARLACGHPCLGTWNDPLLGRQQSKPPDSCTSPLLLMHIYSTTGRQHLKYELQWKLSRSLGQFLVTRSSLRSEFRTILERSPRIIRLLRRLNEATRKRGNALIRNTLYLKSCFSKSTAIYLCCPVLTLNDCWER